MLNVNKDFFFFNLALIDAKPLDVTLSAKPSRPLISSLSPDTGNQSEHYSWAVVGQTERWSGVRIYRQALPPRAWWCTLLYFSQVLLTAHSNQLDNWLAHSSCLLWNIGWSWTLKGIKE